MHKVLYLPLNSGNIIQTGMYDAFNQCGVDLTVFDFYRKKGSNDSIRKGFINTIAELQPSLVHMQLQFTSIINGDTINLAKEISPNTIFTNWTGDIRKNVPGEFIDASKGVDISLISSMGQIDLYKKHLIRKDVRYWQIGYNPKLYYPKGNKYFNYDISFIGTKYNDNLFPDCKLRTEIVGGLIDKYGSRFGLFGGSWGIKYDTIEQSQANDVYANSFACLSVSNFNDEYLYFSDRLLMCLASGRPTISWRFPGWESYFTDMKNIVIVNSIDEISEKLEYLKKNPELANEIGRNGADLVYREHTYFNRASELLRMVGLQ